MGFKKVICLVALSGFLRCTSDLIWNHGKLIPTVMLHFHYIYSVIFCVKTIEKIKANKKPKQRFCPDSELPK